MQKKVHKLQDEQPQGFALIAIASHQNDYRLSWALNRQFNWQLTRSQDLVIKEPKTGVEQAFIRYSYHSPQHLIYHLVTNRCSQGFLLAEHKNIDYVLKIEGESLPGDVKPIIQKIRHIDFVITAFAIETLKSKDKKKLMF